MNSFPLSSNFSNGQFLVAHSYDQWAFALEGSPDWDRFGQLMETSEKGYAEYRLASEDYFATMGIPLRAGRLFESTDTPNSAHVAVISESLAETQWPGQNPIGKLLQFGNMDSDLRLLQVVGMVGDVRDYGVDSQPRTPLCFDTLKRCMSKCK